MSVAEAIDVRGVLLNSPAFAGNEIEQLENAIAGGQIGDVRQAISELSPRVQSEGTRRDSLAIGVACYLIGRHDDAVLYLTPLAGDGVAEYYHAQALLALERYDEAAAMYEKAAADGYDSVHCTLCRVGAIRLSSRLDDAEKLLTDASRDGVTRAEYSYQKGCILSDRGDTFGAIEYFERAVDMDPHHTSALFRLAGENNLLGNDEEAIKLYERALSKPPFFMGALINLGLLYEDAENYSAAEFCFRRVLNAFPNHERARLYLKDIEAASDMYYDEDADRRQRELDQVMQIPLTDFELTARSRHCLERADIQTLGDLTTATEQDLLDGKNFGETSLREIREILESRGLRIGQNVTPMAAVVPTYEAEDLTAEERTLMEMPVTELNLSVRARKCLTRLGLLTVGEVLSRSADQLMSVRNFGVTSLNEIRAKLAERNLSLRNE